MVNTSETRRYVNRAAQTERGCFFERVAFLTHRISGIALFIVDMESDLKLLSYMLRQANGNPNGTNSYNTHIIVRTNCSVFLSSYDNFRHYCKICKANFAVRPWLLSSGGLLSCLSSVV